VSTKLSNLVRPASVTALSAALLVAGCSPSGQAGTAMMGGDQGYHFSRLSCSPPVALPGATVQVVLADMAMTRMMGGDAPIGGRMMLHASPTAVAAGTVSLVARNMGWRTHELIVLPLAGSSSAGRRLPAPNGKVQEAGSLGEASSSCAAGAGQGITSGAVGWVTLKLAPGRYELMCNLKNHYSNGMYEELDVR
jgi:uncharacterized cupredoxin-like copper-binding protein